MEFEGSLVPSAARALLDALPSGFVVVDGSGRVVFENAASTDILGWSPGELIGLELHELIHPHGPGHGFDEVEDDCPTQRVLRTGEAVVNVHEHLRRRDGSLVPVEWSARPLVAADGAAGAGGAVLVFNDATEREANARELRAANALRRIGSRLTRSVAWSVEIPSMAFRLADEAGLVFGDVAASLPTFESLLEVLDVTSLEQFLAAFHDCVDDGVPLDLEIVTSETGQRLRVVGAVERDASGNAVRVVGALQDVSDVVAAREALAMRAQVLEHARDAVMVFDAAGVITYWNDAASRVHGRSAEDVLGRSAVTVLGVDPVVHEAAVRAVWRSGEWSGEIIRTRPDGSEVVLECRWTLLGVALPQVSVLAVETDVTERRLVEDRLVHAQRMESVGTLASGLAHNLNNLLAPIFVAVELLRDETDRSARERLLDTVETSARHGAQILRQVLTYARGAEGPRRRIRVADVVHEVHSIIIDSFPRSIEIDVGIRSDDSLVEVDPGQLQQVILNLCLNARDAMPDGGRLGLEVDTARLDARAIENLPGPEHGVLAPGDFVRLTVSDSGRGIEPAVLQAVFEPFFTTKEAGRGTGLGLPTSLTIVRSYGGTMAVASHPGTGTRFEVYLPVAASGDDTARLDQPSLRSGQGELVLVVDDELALAGVTARLLERHGYRTITATEGSEGLELLRRSASSVSHRVDVVLTDLMMPGVDGLETTRTVRRTFPEVPVVVMSGGGDVDRWPEAKAAGACQLLTKPFTAESLLAAVALALTTAGMS
jgi:PAS domain S-box-containing protein